ncbi:hypothetical protein IFM89_019731 [Coptis chinensis]|uniref:Rhomboid protein n=1 Tax=Coptis chinensis TaxID=261450 RepID=A0A835LIK4_9MAGN|nr:hypothetical protein IFM89_019731 [Coptis chinensis]
MSSPLFSGGSTYFSGFTRLSKGLAVVIIGGSVLLQIFPPAVSYLTLIPARPLKMLCADLYNNACNKKGTVLQHTDWRDGKLFRTIPFAWNLITAGYIEQSLIGMVTSTLGLLFMGRLLEPIWGSREFLKFILVVNFLTSVCVFVTAIALYYITMQETYLYMPLSGFYGVLLGFLVGIKQILPDQEFSIFPQLKIKTMWMPSLMLLLAIAVSFFSTEAASNLPTLTFGTYMSWIYLRYLQSKPETALRGDPSDEFAFSTFFPTFLRPLIDPVASVFDRLLCGRSRFSDDANGYTLGSAPLPGSDPVEASRRRQRAAEYINQGQTQLKLEDLMVAFVNCRERGARALEERLASEKLVPGSNTEELSHSDAADNV